MAQQVFVKAVTLGKRNVINAAKAVKETLIATILFENKLMAFLKTNTNHNVVSLHHFLGKLPGASLVTEHKPYLYYLI